MEYIYLDNAATTKVNKQVLEAVMSVEDEAWGNASGSYSMGKRANRLLQTARKEIAQLIGANEDEIFFTSGATEANNWTMDIARRLYEEESISSIVISDIEHPSIYNAQPLQEGIEYMILPVDENCIVSLPMLSQFMDDMKHPGFLSVMAINNETGAIQPVYELGSICAEHGWIYHCDATQAIGKIPINVKEMRIDMMSVSGHKIGGFKGTGFLYINKHLQSFIKPYISGGDQQNGYRAGTEPVSLYYGLSIAMRQAINNMDETQEAYKKFTELFRALLEKKNIDYIEHCRDNKSYNILNICFPDINAKSLVLALDTDGVIVSAGSACHSDRIEPSKVLIAMGIDKKEALSSIRISFSDDTTLKDIWDTVDYIDKEIKNYREMNHHS